MDLGYFFLFLVIFGVIGFVIEKIWGWNPYTVYSHIGAIILVSGIIFIMLPVIFNPEDINGNINRVTTFFVNVLPGEIVGEVAGAFLAELTGGRR